MKKQKSQSDNSKLFLGAGLVAVLGIGYFAMSTMNKPGTVEDAMEKATNMMGIESLECVYTDEEGRESTTYVKDGKIRSDYTGDQGEEGSMIVADGMMYTWTAGEGMKMKLPDLSDVPEASGDSGGSTPATIADDVMKNIEEYKEYCKETSVDNSLFIPPSDVDFMDQSEMMKNMMEAMPESMDKEQVEKMMQEFGQ